MTDQQIARELTEAANLLVADNYLRKEILNFVDENRDTIETDEYEFAKVKFMGPDGDTRWMNISIEDLERIAKVLR